MIATPHAVTSIFLTTSLERLRIKKSWQQKTLWWTLIAASSFISHFIIDRVPHYDYEFDLYDPFSPYKLILDFLFTTGAFLFVFWLSIKKINKLSQESLGNFSRLQVKESRHFMTSLMLPIWGIFFAWLPDILKALPNNSNQNWLLTRLGEFHVLSHSRLYLNVWQGLFLQIWFTIFLALITKKLAYKNEVERRARLAGQEYDIVFTDKNFS